MSKQYQVFVSSTYEDLIEERLEVMKALLELDCILCGMEYFPAANESQWTFIKNLIDACDYCVVIIGGRYGSEAPEGKSYTQKEYEYALSKDIPTIGFIHRDRNSLPAGKRDDDNTKICKLDNFITLVKSNKLCRDWRNADQLGAVVSRSLTRLMQSHPRTGWVRADKVGSEELQKMYPHLKVNYYPDPNSTYEAIIKTIKKVKDQKGTQPKNIFLGALHGYPTKRAPYNLHAFEVFKEIMSDCSNSQDWVVKQLYNIATIERLEMIETRLRDFSKAPNYEVKAFRVIKDYPAISPLVIGDEDSFLGFDDPSFYTVNAALHIESKEFCERSEKYFIQLWGSEDACWLKKVMEIKWDTIESIRAEIDAEIKRVCGKKSRAGR